MPIPKELIRAIIEFISKRVSKVPVKPKKVKNR